jgi:hypothetical protein
MSLKDLHLEDILLDLGGRTILVVLDWSVQNDKQTSGSFLLFDNVMDSQVQNYVSNTADQELMR